MNKKIMYYSSDNVYEIKKEKASRKMIMTLSLIATVTLSLLAIMSFMKSTTINAKTSTVKYNEIGNIDYRVYLKDNNYYDNNYLNSGMQYVASLIKNINVKFNYEMHATEDIKFNNKYKVIGELEITEKDDPTKVLYKKKEDLVKEKELNITDNNFVINEEVDIDYGKYNNIVNTYKRDLGLVVSSNLILKLQTNTTGEYKDASLTRNNDLKIVIPLSEATLNISMDSNKIDNSGLLSEKAKLIRIDSIPVLILSIVLVILLVINIIIDIKLYIKYFRKDAYNSKVNKILKEYDRLIVNGTADIDENTYQNKFFPDDFNEMVDVAENFNVPILFYEVVPNKKCFFIVIHDDILYKYSLTREELKDLEDQKEKNNDDNKEMEII